VNGRVMRAWETRSDLLRVVADNLIEGPPSAEVDSDIVNGAIQLHALMPDLFLLRYHPDFGLGFTDARGWTAWFGTGTDMPRRMLVYNALAQDLLNRNIRPVAVYVMNPHRPWYSTIVN
jgi:hypothetical protein